MRFLVFIDCHFELQQGNEGSLERQYYPVLCEINKYSPEKYSISWLQQWLIIAQGYRGKNDYDGWIRSQSYISEAEFALRVEDRYKIFDC